MQIQSKIAGIGMPEAVGIGIAATITLAALTGQLHLGPLATAIIGIGSGR